MLLTVVVIILLSWNLVLTQTLLQKVESNAAEVTGYPTDRLDTMWMKINSMERLLHTIPLVECGDQNKHLGETYE